MGGLFNHNDNVRDKYVLNYTRIKIASNDKS